MSASAMPATGRAEEVLPGVFRVGCPFGDGGVVHVYYLDAPEPALIDSGVGPSPQGTVEPALAGAGVRLSAVKHLFNTHGHWDHMGGNESLRAIAGDVRVYIHQEDRYLLENVEHHVRGYTSYPARLTDDQAALAQLANTLRHNVGAPTRADVLVEDGQSFSLGGDWRLRAVHTPGHSLGSTSYLLERAGALFTGDAIQGLGSRPGQLPLVFDDSRAYRATIAKLADLPIQALCMGHNFCALSAGAGRDPVRRGAAASSFLEESGEAAKAVEEAMRSALRGGDPGFVATAQQTLARVASALGVELDPSGLSVRSLATLHAFYRELTGAPKPV